MRACAWSSDGKRRVRVERGPRPEARRGRWSSVGVAGSSPRAATRRRAYGAARDPPERATLAALLAAFTLLRARRSSGGSCARTRPSARRGSAAELLERNAAHLAAPRPRGRRGVDRRRPVGRGNRDRGRVTRCRARLVEILATSGIPGEDVVAPTRTGSTRTPPRREAMRSGEIVEIASGEEYDERFPRVGRRAQTRRRRVGDRRPASQPGRPW